MGSFKCPHCPRTFINHRALGGHASKKHPGMSDTFNNKLKMHDTQTQDRNARNIAKYLFWNFSAGTADDKKRRDLVTTVKKVVVATRPESLVHENPAALPNSWYSKLVEELRLGCHGKQRIFLQQLQPKSGEKALL